MSGRLPALRHCSPSAPNMQSPNILTPDDTMHPPDTFTFPKQPIPQPHIGITLGEEHLSDEGVYHVDKRRESVHKPVSLLTTLLHSPDNHHARKFPATPSVISSARSSAPSTAISSPNGQSHGILQKEAVSILRRGSASSDGGHEGVGLGVMGLEGLAGRLERVEEKRERVEWADEVPVPSINRLKFAVAPRPAQAASFSDSATSSRRPSSPFAKERLLQRRLSEGEDAEDAEIVEDAEDLDSPGLSIEEDDGYEEDEEGGTFSDDEDYAAEIPRGPSPSDFAFARSTNYRRRRISTESAPAVLPPPPRRGRGHIRVSEDVEERQKTATRHCSPPPQSETRGRSGSPSRLSDAGPRANRAGSPMPSRVSSEEDEDDEGSSTKVFEDEGLSVTDGVRGFFRRASEHIPGFRPSGVHAAISGIAGLATNEALTSPSDIRGLGRTRSLNNKVTFDAPIPRRERSAAAGTVPIRCAVRKTEGEVLGWTSDALLAVRRNAGKAGV